MGFVVKCYNIYLIYYWVYKVYFCDKFYRNYKPYFKKHEGQYMKLGIMQPYFFTYIGYFQLIQLVDVYVIADDLNFIKNSYIKKNSILDNGAPALISLELRWIKMPAWTTAILLFFLIRKKYYCELKMNSMWKISSQDDISTLHWIPCLI